MDEPKTKNAVAFFDGQNLYHHAKNAFGHHHPNYDPIKLHEAVCGAHEGWTNQGVRFYTGTPSILKDPHWHGYWTNRLLAMRRSGVLVTHRPLRYYETMIVDENGNEKTIETPQEKGIDVRLALDVVRMARNNQFDVAVVFSQDNDLSEVAEEIRDISRTQQRWIKIVSAFPSGPNATAKRGIEGADWFHMDQDFYDKCLDPRDYRHKT